jgi:hypothetical protein
MRSLGKKFVCFKSLEKFKQTREGIRMVKGTCTRMFTEALFIAKKDRTQPTYPRRKWFN